MSPFDGEDLVAQIPALLAYARILLAGRADPGQAEDLVQDTLERALARADSFRGEARLSTWLHTILYHRFVDLARRRPAYPMADGELLDRAEAAWGDDAYTVDPQVVLANAAVRDRLLDALARLPAIYRGTVVLHDLEDLTLAQIATATQVSLPAAKQRLRRARALLVEILADDSARAAATKGVPMQCWQARSLVDEYLDGGLEVGERRTLEAHLGRCPTCPGLYAGIVGVREAVGALRDPDSVVPPELADRIRAKTREREAKTRERGGKTRAGGGKNGLG